jgi:hypothetical protein
MTLAVTITLALLALAGGWWLLRARGMDRWLLSYLAWTWSRQGPAPGDEVHVLICLADHYEPKFGEASPEQARERVRKWVEEYPRQLGRFRDSSGRTPRHTFFYPAEEYDAELMTSLAELCAAGFGEVEVHLHHDRDTAESLGDKLAEFRDLLALRHGLLGRTPEGEPAWCFIHGNWALCNSRPDGRYCGVNEEIDVLRAAGCKVDMTLPSAPSRAQTPLINCIYWAVNRPGPASHAAGMLAGTGKPPENALMLITGPLLLDWGRRKYGLLPRVENGCVQATQPPTMERLRLWLKAGVRVPARPDWYFVKLHCHGAPEDAHEVLLGAPMTAFHEALAAEAARNPRFHYHYVTAREMYNLARAAESGYTGDVAGALDFEVQPGPALRGANTPAAREG